MKQSKAEQNLNAVSDSTDKNKPYNHTIELRQLVVDLKKGRIEESDLAILRKSLLKTITADIDQIANKSRKKNIIIDYIAAIVGKEYPMDNLDLEKEIRHFLRSLQKK